MGLGARNGMERLRTIWTPEMDWYFVDLLLEQVDSGGKFDDQMFSKRAWKHMLSVFNAKFRFQYEKDVLKNRYKTLRKLYRGVRNILSQPGFSWDEKRKMVTADNNVWEEYLKVHPNARSYRIKSIPYFKSLCTIYGDVIGEKGDNAPEGSSTSISSDENMAIIPYLAKDVGEDAVDNLHGIEVDQEYGFSTFENATDESGQKVPKETPTSFGTRTRTSWQPSMDSYFIKLMLAHVRKGNRVDGVFSKQAWMEMISSFNEKFGFDYSLEIIKNRYKTLRRQYNLISNLLHMEGFAWDEAKQMVTADDSVWQDIIKVHTDARQFMTRPLPHYKDLCIICDPFFDEKYFLEHQNVAVGVKNESPKSGQSPFESDSNEDQYNCVREVAHNGHKQKRQLETSSDSATPKKPRNDEQGMVAALQEMATIVSSLTTKKNDNNLISIENVVHAVQALPDMDEDLVLDACDFLEDEIKAKIFLALDAKLRKKWLIRKLRT